MPMQDSAPLTNIVHQLDAFSRRIWTCVRSPDGLAPLILLSPFESLVNGTQILDPYHSSII